MRFRNWLVGVVALATADVASAFDLFTIDVTSDQLVRIDTDTLQGTYVGPLGLDVTDIDLTIHDGQLLGLVNEFQNVRLVSIDPSTGAVQSNLVATDEAGAPLMMAEGFASDGTNLRLSFSYEFGWSDRYGVMDAASGKVMSSVSLGSMGSQLGRADIDGMGYVPGFGMYGVNGEQPYTEMFNLDLQTLIGLDFNRYVNDLWYEGTTLFAVGGPSLIELRTYDITNGKMLTLNGVTGLNGNANLVGLTGVPEPATMLVLSGASAMLLFRRRRD